MLLPPSCPYFLAAFLVTFLQLGTASQMLQPLPSQLRSAFLVRT